MTTEIATSSWNDERREVWQSVIEAMDSPDLSADRASACRYLLRHLRVFPAASSAIMYS